jgi:2-polyprenyl-3-methyl-5-hydroxy-6-metoxy-1,4-benzoquinol methylase
MYLIDRTLRFTRGVLLSYGPTPVKKMFWDREYDSGKWKFAYHSASDCVYEHLNQYAAGKTVLDMGCGAGNTASEMALGYKAYVGLDISDECLNKARRRSEADGRGALNSFDQGDFLTYVPSRKFDVILFRESMYHVPIGKIKPLLNRLSNYLTPDGVFIVRMYLVGEDRKTPKRRPTAMMELIEREFDVLNKTDYEDGGSRVLVFRPKR